MNSYAPPRLLQQLERYLHEPMNCLTHAVGIVFSLMGLALLLYVSWGEAWRVFSLSVYGLSSVLLYTASSAMHGLKVSPERRRLLLKLDHVGIFCVIAGSYTPILLISLRPYSPALAWGFFLLVWFLAGLGMTLKLWYLDSNHWLSTGFYVLLGWLALFMLGPITQALSGAALGLLLAGGMFYTVGAVIFGLQRPNPIPGLLEHHALWHLFVLAGGFCHFLMLLIYVAPY